MDRPEGASSRGVDSATSSAIDQLPWPEVRRKIDSDPRLILPVGALEQHGPHLPVGSNIMIARHVARAVAAATMGGRSDAKE